MANKVARPSIGVDTILAVYTKAEIQQRVAELKKELEDLYKSASSGGKSGERDLDEVTGQMEAFGKALMILDCGTGLVKTQATFFTGPSADTPENLPGVPGFDTGAGI